MISFSTRMSKMNIESKANSTFVPEWKEGELDLCFPVHESAYFTLLIVFMFSIHIRDDGVVDACTTSMAF